MRILVTGGAGYIGSVTVELLLDEGHEVIVFDNLERGHRAAIDARARLVRGDLRDRLSIADAMRSVEPEAVVHFAAFAYVGESSEQPDVYWRNNVGGGINLAEAMMRTGVKKIVFSSSCSVYGETKREFLGEDTPVRPESPYAESKLMFENILRWYEKLKGFKPVMLRYFNAAGATKRCGEDHEPETHLVPLVLRVAQGRRENLTIFGDDYPTPDGTCIRDYIHILDLARAHVLALSGDIGGVFNLGNGEGFSVKEVVAAAEAATGRRIPVKIGPRRPGDAPRLVACADKARKELGWNTVMRGLPAIIESAWQWQEAHPDGYGKD